MEETPKFFKCSKCGALRKVPSPSKVDLKNMVGCSGPVSGMCDGSFTIEITVEEYNVTLEKWDNERKNKNI